MVADDEQVEGQKGEVAAPGHRPMTFEEKRLLSQSLAGLPDADVGAVLEAIGESENMQMVQLFFYPWPESAGCTACCILELQAC